LRNIIEDAFVLCEDDLITPDNLSIGRSKSQIKAQLDIKETDISRNHIHQKYEAAVIQFEKKYFTQMLELNDWNTRWAAKDAGISREWLSKKIRKLNLRQV